MKTPPFNLHRPNSIQEAISIASELNDSNQQFDWVSGGTDLLPNYNGTLIQRNTLFLLRI